jgi:hypothetical protein
MADCNELFKHFNDAIRLNESKREILRLVRNSLRERMQQRFKEIPASELPNHSLKFQTQGSFIMDTIIAPKDDDFDLDDGVYFLGNLTEDKRASTEIFHKWVLFAVGENENYASVIDKDTCVRVIYKKEKFHIDLPIYYLAGNNDPDLAHKVTNWTLSNPIDFIGWFENKAQSGFQKGFLFETSLRPKYEKWLTDIRKNDVQLRRLVRYLKVWADNLRGDMPPGIVMTILVGENYVAHERDDIALRDTLLKIKDFLAANGGKCPRPTAPVGEDLFEGYSDTKKKYFLDRLDSFINSANQAIASPNQKDACLKWQNHLTERFPCSMAKDEIEGVKKFVKPAVIGDTAKSA